MASGTVKWFNAEKGFGFIQQDGGGPDVFAHYSTVNASGVRELPEAAFRALVCRDGTIGTRLPAGEERRAAAWGGVRTAVRGLSAHACHSATRFPHAHCSRVQPGQ